MMISRTCEYALRAVVWLAAHPDESVGTAAIAEAVKVPPGYLSKVLQGLSRSGLVESRPGRTGGFVLARTPNRMTVLDVINAVDPIERVTRCPLKLKSHSKVLCPLHARIDAAMAAMQEAFATTLISELLEGEPDTSPVSITTVIGA